MKMPPEITLTDAPSADMRKAILDPLLRFNQAQAGVIEDYRALAILISDPETHEILGGLWGGTIFSQLHIDLLFVPEPLRRAGLGRRLMTLAETEAIRRGCRVVWLDTYSFQARGFYERLGYVVFGTIEDCPPGHSRFWLKKTFQPPR
jgi:GNAT superfamily N-acetyltransferase